MGWEKNKRKKKILYQEYSSAGINLPNIYIYIQQDMQDKLAKKNSQPRI